MGLVLDFKQDSIGFNSGFNWIQPGFNWILLDLILDLIGFNSVLGDRSIWKISGWDASTSTHAVSSHARTARSCPGPPPQPLQRAVSSPVRASIPAS